MLRRFRRLGVADVLEHISGESIQAGMMTELRYTISLRPGHKPGELVSSIQQVNGNNRVLLTSAAPSRTLGTD